MSIAVEITRSVVRGLREAALSSIGIGRGIPSRPATARLRVSRAPVEGKVFVNVGGVRGTMAPGPRRQLQLGDAST